MELIDLEAPLKKILDKDNPFVKATFLFSLRVAYIGVSL